MSTGFLQEKSEILGWDLKGRHPQLLPKIWSKVTNFDLKIGRDRSSWVTLPSPFVYEFCYVLIYYKQCVLIKYLTYNATIFGSLAIVL